MNRNRKISRRATVRLNRNVLSAVRDIDHPGLLADCVCCSDDVQETVSKERKFLGAMQKISTFLTSQFATEPAYAPTYRS